MENTFFNTTNLSGDALKKEHKNMKNQQERILHIFKQYKKGMTPTQVHFIHNDLFQYNRCPITSIRRAMTNLADANKLVKTEKQRIGAYDKPNYVWILGKETPSPEKPKQEQLFKNFKLKTKIKRDGRESLNENN